MTLDTTDVAVIGGGIMGCAVALRLAQRGVGVTVVERGIPGAEASSAAAGILGPQMEADGPGPLLELGLASRARDPALGPAIRAALVFPDDGQVNARELARAFSQAAAAAGARFLTGRYVRRVVVEGGAATGVELDGETLPAGAVV